VADESGVVRIPKAKAVEVANRAMDVLEHENRLREEIRRKATLGNVAELHRWEKKIVDGLDGGADTTSAIRDEKRPRRR